MAYLPFSYEDEKERKEAGFGQLPQRSGTTPVPATPSAPTQSASSPGIGPSGFVNFSAYLNANKDAATRTSNQMAGRLEQGAKSSQQKLADAYGKFSQGVQGGTLSGPAAGVGVAGVNQGSTPGTQRQGLEGTPQRNTDTAPLTLSPEEAAAKAAQSYTGPAGMSDVADWDKVRAATDTAQRNINATGQDGGVEALLRDQYGAGGYSQGESMFDAALAGTTGRKRFADQRRQYGGLTKNLEGTVQDAAKIAEAAKTSSQAAAEQYGQLLSDYEKRREEEAAAAAAAEREKQKAASSTKSEHPYDPEYAEPNEKLGMSREEVADYFRYYQNEPRGLFKHIMTIQEWAKANKKGFYAEA